MSGYGALAGAGVGLIGGGISAMGAHRKKKALKGAEADYYNAMMQNQAQEHAVGGMEQADYGQLAQGHNTNLGSLVQGFTTAAPVEDNFSGRLADTVGQARASVPVMNQSWAYQGNPATETTAREETKTAGRRNQLANVMTAEHRLQSQQDQQQLALTGFERGEMPLSSHAQQLAQYYGIGGASRGYNWQNKKNALAMALKKAGYTGDEQMMWGSLVGSLSGAGGGMGGGSSNDSSPSYSDTTTGGFQDQNTPPSGGYYDNSGRVVASPSVYT